ncbi:MAG TPA: hypothetical protein VFK57_11290 [Vicinamibacterales bacterium]|nr:hypothetical protein [Vicinamibacterales bacterium]
MILLALITGVVIGPAVYFGATGRTPRKRLILSAVAVAAVFALEIVISIYFAEWLGAD